MDGITNDEMRKKYAKIVAKAWADEDYKKKLIASPKEILKQEGVEIPDKIKINIFENTDNELNFVLPNKPNEFNNICEIENRIVAATTNQGPSGGFSQGSS